MSFSSKLSIFSMFVSKIVRKNSKIAFFFIFCVIVTNNRIYFFVIKIFIFFDFRIKNCTRTFKKRIIEIDVRSTICWIYEFIFYFCDYFRIRRRIFYCYFFEIWYFFLIVFVLHLFIREWFENAKFSIFILRTYQFVMDWHVTRTWRIGRLAVSSIQSINWHSVNWLM